MTPEQLEAAARKLCEIRGWDWREDVSLEGRKLEMALDVAKWEIRAYLEIQEAIQWTVRRSTCSQGNRLDLHRTRDGVGGAPPQRGKRRPPAPGSEALRRD